LKTLIIIAVLAVVALGTWLLTGFDKSPGGESKRDHHLTRALRTVGVVVLLAIFILVMGGNPGILRRTLEVLELIGDERGVSLERVDQASFRLGEQNAFAWTKAWQGGQIPAALQTMRLALEDDPSSGGPLMLLGQARREVERLCRLAEARLDTRRHRAQGRSGVAAARISW